MLLSNVHILLANFNQVKTNPIFSRSFVQIVKNLNCNNQLEKVDLVITVTPAFQILNEAMKGMKHVIYLTTYSFHGHQQSTNSCNWQCSKLFIACQINLNQITCNHFLFSFTIYIKTLIIRHMMETLVMKECWEKWTGVTITYEQ